MFMTSGDGGSAPGTGVYEADGETFEIRYVDPAEAELWASERGMSFNHPNDIPPPLIGYFD